MTKGTYETQGWTVPRITQVDAGNGRQFLVLQTKAPEKSSLILLWDVMLKCWVSIGSTSPDGDPVDLVTGVLMRSRDLINPIDILKKDLAIQRRANGSLMSELRRSSRQKVRLGSGERGRRGCRNP